MRGIIHPGRSSSLREWTRVEAVLKADGRGLRVAPATLSITEGEGVWHASVGDSDRRYTGWEVIGPPGVLASVAVEPVSAAADTAAAGALDR
jgi:4'-phosphopantetheinyl transferase